MSIFDALELLDLLDLLFSWRFFVCLLAGIGLGFAVYLLGNQSPAAGIIASLIGVAGLVIGMTWQWRHERSA